MEEGWGKKTSGAEMEGRARRLMEAAVGEALMEMRALQPPEDFFDRAPKAAASKSSESVRGDFWEDEKREGWLSLNDALWDPRDTSTLPPLPSKPAAENCMSGPVWPVGSMVDLGETPRGSKDSMEDSSSLGAPSPSVRGSLASLKGSSSPPSPTELRLNVLLPNAPPVVVQARLALPLGAKVFANERDVPL